jgi:hypothetical protein
MTDNMQYSAYPTMGIKKIITHGGEFHADEVSAIALFFILNKRTRGDIFIEKKFIITPEELADPSILIIDIGRNYNPELGNLDHHQDANLEASNLLMVDYLLMMGEDERVLQRLRELLFERISDVDLGKAKPLSYEYSSLIKNCVDFDQAFEMAYGIIARMLINIEKSILDEERYKSLPKVGRVAIQEDSEIILGWKDLAFGTGVCFLVCPNVRGGWNLISSDSDLYCIPESSNQTFRHNTGFMAVYLTKEEAVEAGTSFKVKFF